MGKEPHMFHYRRKKLIEQCQKWTAKDGYFPHDHGLNFHEMSDSKLQEYHSCYEWALDEKNFHNFNLSNKKGG